MFKEKGLNQKINPLDRNVKKKMMFRNISIKLYV